MLWNISSVERIAVERNILKNIEDSAQPKLKLIR